MTDVLAARDLAPMDAYRRGANDLTIGQLYLLDDPVGRDAAQALSR